MNILNQFYFSESTKVNKELERLSKLVETEEISTLKLTKLLREEISKEKNIRKAIFLQRIQRSIKRDTVWEKLSSNRRGSALKLMKKIISKELVETHMHFGPSTDSWVHWKYLKKTWKSYKKRLKELVEKELTDVKTYRRISYIMNNYLKKRKTEVECALQFDNLLIMKKTGSFHAFESKASITNAIEYAVAGKALESKYFKEQLTSIARYAKQQNILRCEIRFPATEHLIFHARNARVVEKETGINMRYIEFPMRDCDNQFALYNKTPSWTKKYLIGFDYKGQKKKAESLPKPIMVHAGELMLPSDYAKWHPGIKTKKDVIEHMLTEVERVLTYKNLARIGHGSVLGLDLSSFGEQFVKRQQKILKKTVKRKIVVEVNPTSNIMIGGYPMHKHPAKKMIESGVQIAISTDDKTNFDTNLRREYFELYTAIGKTF